MKYHYKSQCRDVGILTHIQKKFDKLNDDNIFEDDVTQKLGDESYDLKMRSYDSIVLQCAH